MDTTTLNTLASAVTTAQTALNTAVAAAVAEGLTVTFGINGATPTKPISLNTSVHMVFPLPTPAPTVASVSTSPPPTTQASA